MTLTNKLYLIWICYIMSCTWSMWRSHWCLPYIHLSNHDKQSLNVRIAILFIQTVCSSKPWTWYCLILAVWLSICFLHCKAQSYIMRGVMRSLPNYVAKKTAWLLRTSVNQNGWSVSCRLFAAVVLRPWQGPLPASSIPSWRKELKYRFFFEIQGCFVFLTHISLVWYQHHLLSIPWIAAVVLVVAVAPMLKVVT